MVNLGYEIQYLKGVLQSLNEQLRTCPPEKIGNILLSRTAVLEQIRHLEDCAVDTNIPEINHQCVCGGKYDCACRCHQ
jgi:hypothetical protein